MNLKKINNEIVRLHHSESETVIVQRVDDTVYVTDKYVAFVLNDSDFIFDINKFKSADIKSIVENDLHLPLEDARIDKIILEDKKQYAILKNETIEVMINNKYLSYFDENCTLKVIDEKHPVIVFEHDEVVGIILPIVRY